jgi:hypothetical protein
MEVVAKEGDRPQELFIVVDDVRVAKRGDPNTPQALTWVPLVPGWEVVDKGDDALVVTYNDDPIGIVSVD